MLVQRARLLTTMVLLAFGKGPEKFCRARRAPPPNEVALKAVAMMSRRSVRASGVGQGNTNPQSPYFGSPTFSDPWRLKKKGLPPGWNRQQPSIGPRLRGIAS